MSCSEKKGKGSRGTTLRDLLEERLTETDGQLEASLLKPADLEPWEAFGSPDYLVVDKGRDFHSIEVDHAMLDLFLVDHTTHTVMTAFRPTVKRKRRPPLNRHPKYMK